MVFLTDPQHLAAFNMRSQAQFAARKSRVTRRFHDRSSRSNPEAGRAVRARFNTAKAVFDAVRPMRLTRHACAYAGASAGRQNRYSYMAEATPTEYFIQGVTKSGKTFRPSDWSERLCGVMSAFGPGARGPNARLQYSIYVRPTMLGNVKTVIVDSRLRDVEPMAFDFVMNFAKDNDLVVTEACELPPHHGTQVNQR
jgi:hypothetical protein